MKITPNVAPIRPIHILLTHPLKPTMIKYLQAIHELISPYDYDEFAWSLCMSDGQQCVFDDMMVVNRGGWGLDRVYHGNRMSEVREWLEENDYRVDPRAKPYLVDYDEIKRQLWVLRECVEVEHLVLRKAGKGGVKTNTQGA